MSFCSHSIVTFRWRRARQDARTAGGVVHSARFRRKPRGGPGGLGEGHAQRFGFCCSVDLCRCRKTPPSFRFLDRKA